MPTFVHISDLHFGREQPAVIEAWFRATQTIQPDLVILSGDLTQRATDEEYTAAQQFLAKLAWPYFVIPGNHDISATDLPERFLKPWNRWQHSIGAIEPVLKTEGYTVVGVCTAKTAGWYFDWSRGGISKEQMIAVQEKFQGGAAERLRVVVAHHPFWLPEQSEY
ncbi:MAG TPA: metallophosphoesterase, partial [Thiolinea sp.]|nr:metallophosphoesterase [Thiolinea sp.]